ncbi:MAG: hypothetical protein HY819_18415 [Acidobacteria bacterium]|nr:hypothetical protein [Acidobacteriota bacterium]
MRINSSNETPLQNTQEINTSKATQSSESLHQDVMRDTAIRESLKNPTSLLDHKARLSGQFERSKSDFEAKKLRQLVDEALPTTPNAAAGGAVVTTTDVTRSAAFSRLSSSQRSLINKTLSDNRNNSQLAAQFKEMIESPVFSRLSSTEKGYSLNGLAKNIGALSADILQFTQTNSYKDFNRMQKQQGQLIIGLLSADAAQNPSHNPMSRNTVLALTTGNVELGLPSKVELKREGFTDADLQGLYGFAYENTMYFNVYRPGLLDSREDMVRTAAHEINHVLNDRTNDTEYDTPERALDEYRAWYVENFAVGINPPSVDYMQGVWENFFSPNAGYDNIREVYVKDPAFRKIIDQIKTDLDNGKVTDPEAFRKSLASLIGKDPFIKNPTYLTTPGNLDNTLTTSPRRAE